MAKYDIHLLFCELSVILTSYGYKVEVNVWTMKYTYPNHCNIS